MSKNIDAVIAALKTELSEAERYNSHWWPAARCNRWIRQLPGGWWRWRNLKIYGYANGEVTRAEFITHVRATLAYLQTSCHDIGGRSPLYYALRDVFRNARREAGTDKDDPIDAEFTDVPTKSAGRKMPKPIKVVK
jgi:hypothetical protein